MPRTLLITPLVDPTLDRVGFPLEHRYVEQVWLSIAGPIAELLLRHCGRTREAEPAGVRVDLVDLSRSVGLQARDGAELGRSSHLVRTLDRVVQFRLAAWASEDRLAVHRRVPAVGTSRVERLPARVQGLHHQLLTEHLQSLVAIAETGPGGSTTSAERLAALGRTTDPERSHRKRQPMSAATRSNSPAATVKAAHVYEAATASATHVSTHVRAHVYVVEMDDPRRYTFAGSPFGEPAAPTLVTRCG